MDWQMTAVGLIVFAAVGYLARSAWSTWSGKKSECGSACRNCETIETKEPTRRIRLL
jgi:hypothetical protein